MFLYGLAASDHPRAAALFSGALLGLLSGAAVGGALYAGLVRIPVRWLFGVTSLLILLLASGMAGQIARLLNQGDFLPDLGGALWDTSHVLPMDSPIGSLLHVLMGYEARPSAMQVLFYSTAFCLIVLGMAWSGRSRHQRVSTTSPAPIQSA